jgi:hypothetical protein
MIMKMAKSKPMVEPDEIVVAGKKWPRHEYVVRRSKC